MDRPIVIVAFLFFSVLFGMAEIDILSVQLRPILLMMVKSFMESMSGYFLMAYHWYFAGVQVSDVFVVRVGGCWIVIDLFAHSELSHCNKFILIKIITKESLPHEQILISFFFPLLFTLERLVFFQVRASLPDSSNNRTFTDGVEDPFLNSQPMFLLSLVKESR